MDKRMQKRGLLQVQLLGSLGIMHANADATPFLPNTPFPSRTPPPSYTHTHIYPSPHRTLSTHMDKRAHIKRGLGEICVEEVNFERWADI